MWSPPLPSARYVRRKEKQKSRYTNQLGVHKYVCPAWVYLGEPKYGVGRFFVPGFPPVRQITLGV